MIELSLEVVLSEAAIIFHLEAEITLVSTLVPKRKRGDKKHPQSGLEDVWKSRRVKGG